jgi:alkylhydroperoxidase family enzyme
LAATVKAHPGVWDAADTALLSTCEEMDAGTRLSDAGWASLREHFSEEQVLEAMALAGFYRTVCLHANVLQLPPEPFAARFPVE